MKAKHRSVMILRDYRGFDLAEFKVRIWGAIEVPLEYVAGGEKCSRVRVRDLHRRIRTIIDIPPTRTTEIDWITYW